MTANAYTLTASLNHSADSVAPERHPRTRAIRAAPFAGAAALTWIAVAATSSIDWRLYSAASVLLLAAGAVRLALPWRTATSVISSLVFLGAVALLRSSAGGINSGAAVVSLIPVFYVALYDDGVLTLMAVIAGVAAFYLIPILLVGPPEYPRSQYRAALLTVAVAAIIGLATRRLVDEVRTRADDALHREHMLEQVNAIVRRLSTSAQARQEVCEAARAIGEAVVAVLYEPTPERPDALRSSAIAGIDSEPVEVSLLEHTAVAQAFRSGSAQLVTDGVEHRVGSRELWIAAGRPTSVLYEPLLRGTQPVGVLVVAWPAGKRADGPRAAVVSLLAHEAAAVIDRSDTINHLSDMAQTDPLTGLPNRRMWDARLAQALSERRPFAVAMLDLDHFKQYNDTHGHPAGDRLLKETAALWRDQLRSGDMLARIGGEEFGLLLPSCGVQRASEVIDRLRSLIYANRTCSAGLATWQQGESADALMARADAALYEAKAAGRDRMCLSAP